MNNRFTKLPKAERGPDGRWSCRWCGGEVPKGRLKWCSEACVEAYKVRAWGSHARNLVFRRDHGVCAACGLDTTRLERRYRAADHYAALRRWDPSLRTIGRDPMCQWQESETTRAFYESARLRFLRFRERLVRAAEQRRARYLQAGWPLRGAFWQADHKVPVQFGGGACGLENLQTLCHLCHKAKTSEQRRRVNKKETTGETTG